MTNPIDTREGWLQISTAGFSSFNKARPPEHLIKELVQNAFDAVGDSQGSVTLDMKHDGSAFTVTCRDSGEGISDLSAVRVVYLTFKQDSHLKRGRFGRGFKEILSVAETATVTSGQEEIAFVVEGDRQVTRTRRLEDPVVGSSVTMTFDWPAETVDALTAYFASFLVPARYGRPEIFNTDQGSQFTSIVFTDVLKDAGVKISMDGKGRWMDNVFIERLWRSLKYECVYLNAFESSSEARAGIGCWIDYYNQRRPHSALGRAKTPEEEFAMQWKTTSLAA